MVTLPSKMVASPSLLKVTGTVRAWVLPLRLSVPLASYLLPPTLR